MKRRIAKLALFLLLGAIINVAVAWGCALWVNIGLARAPSHASHGAMTLDGKYWGVQRFDRCGAVRIRSSRDHIGVRKDFTIQWQDPQDLVPSWTGFQSPSAQYVSGMADRDMRCAEGRGWPALSMWHEADYSRYERSGDEVPIRGGIEIGRWPAPHEETPYARSLPLRIITRGFLLDSSFYAAILWLLFAFPFTLRRRRRIKRGLCPACAYPVGDSAVCTECGKLVPAVAIRQAVRGKGGS